MTLGAYPTRMLFSDFVGNRIGSVMAREASAGQWSRSDSEVSSMTTTFTAATPELADLEPWLHDASVYRGDELVWRGVVFTTETSGNQCTIVARDPGVYFDRRRIAQDRHYVQQDLSDIAAELVRDAMAIHDPFNVMSMMMVEPSGLYADRDVKAESRMLAEELKDLVDAGLTWTFHGGRLLIGPVGTQHTTGTISDADLDAKVTITKDGSDTVNDARVLGKTSTATWYDYSSPLGVLQSIEKKDALTDAHQCEDAARALVKERSTTPRRISLPGSARIMATAPVTINELIVNANVPVRMAQTGVLINQLMRVSEVNAKFAPARDEISMSLVQPRAQLEPNELSTSAIGN